MQKTRKCGMNVFNILVVEDNIELQELYCISLYNNGYNALHAKDGIEALDILEHHFIDLVISDIMMPNMDGFQLVKELKDIDSRIPVLIISAKGDAFYKEKAFKLGIDDYMVKPINVNEMIWRVEAILRRCGSKQGKEISIGDTILYYESLQINDKNGQYFLPQKEFYLLYKLVSSVGNIFTKQQLFDEIWGFDSETDIHTIDVHIARIREKFRDNTDFSIVTIRGLGYKVMANEIK